MKQATSCTAFTFLWAKSHPLLQIEALGFCKVPKTGVITLLGVRQVWSGGALPLAGMSKEKEEKQKLEIKRESTRPRERSSRSTPLNTLAVLSHKELGPKGFDTSFHNPPQEMGVTVEMETSAGA